MSPTQGAAQLPQVKQCVTTGDWQYGATATAAGAGRWLVANPTNGGHWATDDDVADWAVFAPLKAVKPTDPTPAVDADPAAGTK